MITYEPGDWGVRFIFRLNGSVLPRAIVWGLSCGLATAILNVYAYGKYSVEGVGVLWGGYTSVLGFLVVFRNNEAYARFWEGTALMYQVRGEWLNAGSSLVAFCSAHVDRRTEVMQFQEVLMRLLSMLHCSALQMIAEVDDDTFEIISPIGMDPERVQFIMRSDRRTQIAVQWIQRSVVEACRSGVLDVPAPILSRVFQELSRGIVNLHNIRKIKDVPLPFPYAQTMSGMMLLHWIITPIIASQSMESPLIAGVLTLGIQTAFWSIIYIAREIEQPFGDDNNDLPMPGMQIDFNESLELLLQEQVQTAPTYLDIQGCAEGATQRDRCSFGESHMSHAVTMHKVSSMQRESEPGEVKEEARSSIITSFFGGRQFSPPSIPTVGHIFGTRRKSNAGRHLTPDRHRSPGSARAVSPAVTSNRGSQNSMPSLAEALEQALGSPASSGRFVTPPIHQSHGSSGSHDSNYNGAPECPVDLHQAYSVGSVAGHSFGAADMPSESASRQSSPDNFSRVSTGRRPSKDHIERHVSPSFGSDNATTPRSTLNAEPAAFPRLVSRPLPLPAEECLAEVPETKASVVEMGSSLGHWSGRPPAAATALSRLPETISDQGGVDGGQPPPRGTPAATPTAFLDAMRRPPPGKAAM